MPIESTYFALGGIATLGILLVLKLLRMAIGGDPAHLRSEAEPEPSLGRSYYEQIIIDASLAARGEDGELPVDDPEYERFMSPEFTPHVAWLALHRASLIMRNRGRS